MRLKGIAAMALVGTMAVAGMDAWGGEKPKLTLEWKLNYYNVINPPDSIPIAIEKNEEWEMKGNVSVVIFEKGTAFGSVEKNEKAIPNGKVGFGRVHAWFSKEGEKPKDIYSNTIKAIRHKIAQAVFVKKFNKRTGKTTIQVRWVIEFKSPDPKDQRFLSVSYTQPNGAIHEETGKKTYMKSFSFELNDISHDPKELKSIWKEDIQKQKEFDQVEKIDRLLRP